LARGVRYTRREGDEEAGGGGARAAKCLDGEGHELKARPRARDCNAARAPADRSRAWPAVVKARGRAVTERGKVTVTSSANRRPPWLQGA
jgi:hypothetical protein